MREARPRVRGRPRRRASLIPFILASLLLAVPLAAWAQPGLQGTPPARGPGLYARPRVSSSGSTNPRAAAASPTRLAVLNGTGGLWAAVTANSVEDIFAMGDQPAGVQWKLGDGVTETGPGTTNFTAGSDPDYAQITILLTDGINDYIELDVQFPQGGGSGYGFSENVSLGEHPDLIGYSVDFIRLVVHDLHLVSINGGTQVFENYTWEIWGHRIFVAFAPPTDPNGTYLIDRRYTFVNVTLEAPATAVLNWNGSNVSMMGSATSWYLNVSALPNGVYRYRVWATNATGTFGSELRVLTVGVGIWVLLPGGNGFWPSLVIDSQGTLHVCFYAAGSVNYSGLVYGTHDDAGWHFTPVDGGLGDTGQSCSLALDAEGRPHISYLDGPYFNGSFAVRHAYFNGSAWVLQTVAYGLYTPTAIALNPVTDLPMIAYSNSPSIGLLLATTDGTRWSSQLVNASFSQGYFSLAVNASGYPRIAYATWPSGPLVYAQWTGSTWVLSTVDASAFTLSLRLNASGLPRIVYAAPSGLKYARNDGTSWANQTVDVHGSSVGGLILDAQGRPHIVYGAASGSQVRYAVLNGTWAVQVVSNHLGDTGLTLGLLPSGDAGIVFESSQVNGNLIYATNQNLSGLPPVASLSADATTVVAGTMAHLTSASHGPAGWGLTSELWDFGDGVTSTDVTTSQFHTYDKPGNYTVTLTVTDAWGASAVASLVMRVTPAQPLALVDYASPRGYVIPVPAGWSRSYNVTEGGYTYELFLQGTVGVTPANLLVDTENASGVQETDAYLSSGVQQILAGVQAQLPDAYLVAPAHTFPLAGHLAATFEVGYSSHPLIQLVLLVASQRDERIWSAILTGSMSQYAVLNATFGAIVAGFRITVTSPPPSWMFIVPEAIGLILVVAVLAALLVVYIRRKAKTPPLRAATVTCASCGGPLQPGERFCGHCGAPTEAGPPPQQGIP